jgi:hypothetical protein
VRGLADLLGVARLARRLQLELRLLLLLLAGCQLDRLQVGRLAVEDVHGLDAQLHHLDLRGEGGSEAEGEGWGEGKRRGWRRG